MPLSKAEALDKIRLLLQEEQVTKSLEKIRMALGILPVLLMNPTETIILTLAHLSKRLKITIKTLMPEAGQNVMLSG